jgi:hypothetical protein
MIKVFSKVWLVALILCSFAAQNSFGADARSKKKFGVYVDYNQPSTLIGNLGFNLGNIARLHAGYGQNNIIGKSSVINLGVAEGGLTFFVPQWDITPAAGVSYMYVTGKVAGFSASGGAPIVYAGLDVSVEAGLNAGARIILAPTLPGSSASQSVYFGWYF